MYSPVLFLALALYLSRTVSAAGAFTDTCANVDVVLSYTDADGNPVTGPEYAACSCYKQVANKINSDPDLSDFLDQLDEDGGDVNDVYDEVSDAVSLKSSLAPLVLRFRSVLRSGRPPPSNHVPSPPTLSHLALPETSANISVLKLATSPAVTGSVSAARAGT